MHPPPSVTASITNRLAFKQSLDTLQESLEKQEKEWISEMAFPICFSDGGAEITVRDLKTSGMHVLVWAASGCGWETPASPPPMELERLANALKENVEPTKLPKARPQQSR